MKIGEKHKLHLDQLAGLEMETNSVILGFTEPNDFPKMLSDSIQVDVSKANDIAKDVSDMLFKKIRDSMKKTYWKENAEVPPVSPTPMPSPAPMRDISVVMPSKLSTGSPAPEPTRPKITVSAAPSAPSPTAPAKPAVPNSPPAPKTPPPQPPVPPMHAPEVMLSEPTVSIPQKPANPPPIAPQSAAPTAPPKAEPPKPGTYKTDPYREPPE